MYESKRVFGLDFGCLLCRLLHQVCKPLPKSLPIAVALIPA